MHFLSTVVAALAIAEGVLASPFAYYPISGYASVGVTASIGYTAGTGTGTSYPTATAYAKAKREDAALAAPYPIVKREPDIKRKRDAAINERDFFSIYATGTIDLFPTGTGFPFPVLPTGTGFPTGWYAKEKRFFPTGTYYFPTAIPTGFISGYVTGTVALPTATGWAWPKVRA